MVRRGALRAILGGAFVALGLGGAAACVLADPPADLPVTPIEPPRIVTETPPISLLVSLPGEFVLFVSADPRVPEGLQSQLFVDQLGEQPRSQTIPADGGVLVLVDDPPPTDVSPDECHTIEVRVSYPGILGSDSATWFYSPTGSFTNCPIFDAGPPDAGADADEAGTGEAGSGD